MSIMTHSGEEHKHWTQVAQSPVPVLLLNICVILGKLLDLSEPQFPHMKMGVMVLIITI